jgi:hypothetical protein
LEVFIIKGLRADFFDLRALFSDLRILKDLAFFGRATMGVNTATRRRTL